MKILEKIGIGKKKEEEEEITVVKPVKQSAISKIGNILQIFNQPMGGGLGYNPNPKRSLRERQLGIPEYVLAHERVKNFIKEPKPIPKSKKVITNWRPTPGKVSRKGEEVKW